jgi:hypothetical protein
MTEGVRLEHGELECLRRILSNPDSLPETCRESAVHHLLDLGMVERVLLLALPVIPPRYGYRITERGRRALHAVE